MSVVGWGTMEFKTELIGGRLIKRYKRFLADVTLDTGEEITAHVANPGAMTGLKEPGSKVWLSISDNPKRKLKYSWELIEPEGFSQVIPLVGVNTAHPNGVVAEAIEAGAIKELLDYATLRREVKYGEKSRIDILLQDVAEGVVENVTKTKDSVSKPAKPSCYVEVKSVTLMREAGLAEFPDAVTARGSKHLEELSNMVREGARAVMLYLIQRTDADQFSIAGDIDPKYAQAFEMARAAGVEMLVYDCNITTSSIDVGREIPISI